MSEGRKTSEFWLALSVVASSTILLLLSQIDTETWTWAISLSTGGYTLSRTVVKAKARRR